ncbi:MAG: flagellar motor protein MotB [Desulfovibrionaceae bacterium]
MPSDDENGLSGPSIDEGDEGAEDWIVTFADLNQLLLVFFILLFSLSTLDPVKFTDSFTSVKQALGEKTDKISMSKVQTQDAAVLESVRLQKQIIESQKKVYSDIRTFLNTKGVEGVIGAVFDEGVITIRVPSGVLFDEGKVEMNPDGTRVLMMLKNLFIQRNDQNINIRGFTDDVRPSSSSRFKDNWEISALRAVNVLRFYLQQGIESNRLTATGLADLDPLFPNTTPQNRAKNRRVEFVLEKRVSR